jgi:ribulose-phosphate 3-epimerase
MTNPLRKKRGKQVNDASRTRSGQGNALKAPKLAPSILSADFAKLGEAVAAAEAGGADWIHVDVMDGHFVPNLTFGPKMVADLHRATRLPLDVHLMIERPEESIGRYVEAGAAYLTVHVEAARDPAAVLDAIRAAGARPGITLNPETDVSRVLPLIDRADLVLVMSVHPGFGGQEFISSALDKLRTLRAALDAKGAKAELEVDGGIKPENARDAARAGASVLVAGSAVYLDPDGVGAALAKLRRAIA